MNQRQPHNEQDREPRERGGIRKDEILGPDEGMGQGSDKDRAGRDRSSYELDQDPDTPHADLR